MRARGRWIGLALLSLTAGCQLVAGLHSRSRATATDGGEENGNTSGGSGGVSTGGAGAPGGSGGNPAGGSGGTAPGGSGGVTTGGGSGTGGLAGTGGAGTGGAGTGGAIDAGADAAPPPGSCPPWGRLGTCDPRYNDAENCCVAGRSCGGGICVSGKCRPNVLDAQVTTDLQDIQVTGNYLVIGAGCEHRARRYSKTGGGEFLLPLDLDGKCVPRVGVAGDQVYWIEWDGPYLQGAPLDGSAQARHVAKVPITLADVTLRQMAIDAQRAYWVTSDPSAVWFAPLNGTGGPAKAVAAQQSTGLTMETTSDAFGVTVDATHVYWSDRDQHNIRRRALATLDMNLPAEQVATGGVPRHLTTDADHVYWVTEDGFIMSHPKTPGGAPTMLAANQANAFNIVVDDQYVYWTRYMKDGTVARTPKAGGAAVEELATAQKFPLGLAQECGTIYWTNQNDYDPGDIVRLTK